ncbi:MAG TPA: PilW family protein, partial [Noviherbaspirillum sp.]|nr:PilW family protein [Noviherbaspirillum sp.]
VLVTTGLLLSTRSSFLTQDDDIHLHDSARFAFELIARSVRQAAYENWDTDEAPVLAADDLTPNIRGLNARRLSASTAGGVDPLAASGSPVNGSDVLAVRFFGSGPPATPGAWTGGDGTVLNCAGASVPTVQSLDEAEERRGWSIFYVARSASNANEPELYCKYRGPGAYAATAIVPGVESFQVLYGVDIDGDGMPERYLHAGQVDALDDALVLTGASPAEQAADLRRRTHWKRIATVRIALLVRGANPARADLPGTRYDLFGADYSLAAGGADPGVRIEESAIAAGERNRMRRVFSTTIQLRNRSAGSGAGAGT